MNKLITFALICGFCACTTARFNPKWAAEKSPETFIARFETSKGNFDVEITRSLSPKAADRMFQLMLHHFFDGTLFYRVVPDFVAQFGNLDTAVTNNWERYTIADEPLLKSNTKGTLSFARAGKDSRGTHLFINLRDNPKLDTLNYSDVIGFPTFGVVIKGMEVVESLYAGYGDTVFEKFDSLASDKQKFLHQFPKLDSIRSTSIVKPGR